MTVVSSVAWIQDTRRPIFPVIMSLLKEEIMTNEDYNPDRLPALKDSLIRHLDGLVLEATMLHNLTDLEAVYIATLLNIESFTSNLIEMWGEQGKPDQIAIGSAAIQGMIDTSNWMRAKAETLITDSEKYI